MVIDRVDVIKESLPRSCRQAAEHCTETGVPRHVRCTRKKATPVSFAKTSDGRYRERGAYVVDELEHGLAGVDEHLNARAVAAQPATGLRERVLSRHTRWSDIAA